MPGMKRIFPASFCGALLSLCAASALATGRAEPETFIIHADPSGHEATVKVPVGAVSAFSATNAEALPNYADPEVEAMRLSGDVLIDVVATGQRIRIKADRVLLELTADEAAAGKLPPRDQRQMRSSRVIVDGEATQTFVGNVVFTLQTAAGAMQIRADRLEHTDRIDGRSGPRAGA